MPATARPSTGHGALLHWTPDQYWLLALGRWGRNGRTTTRYHVDSDFHHSGKARNDKDGYWKVKRAQWYGDVLGESRIYGKDDPDAKKNLKFWYGVSLNVQAKIVEKLPPKKPSPKLPVHGEDKWTWEEKVVSTPAPAEAKSIRYDENGVIFIPAAAGQNVRAKNHTQVMPSFQSGYQLYLFEFEPKDVKEKDGGTKSNFSYKLRIPKDGDYSLVANICTVQYDQKLHVSVQGVESSARVIHLPFTLGDWEDSPAVTVPLKKGVCVLNFWRQDPPQNGVSLSSFTLTPIEP
jgi:hypothetical protein